MTQLAKTQEPSMEEILASIRRIIADDETKPAGTQAAAEPKVEPPRAPPKALTPAQAPPPAPPAPVVQTAAAKPAVPPPAAKNSQDDIDAMLAGLDAETSEAEIRAPEPPSEVFELTEQMAIPEAPPAATPPAASFRQVDPQDDLEFSEPRPVAKNYQTPALDPPAFAASEAPNRLLSSSTMASVESAFNSLANTVLSNNARTLEDLVKEMLRPMLKSWLDDNLPNMVERIVRSEIERVSRGR